MGEPGHDDDVPFLLVYVTTNLGTQIGVFGYPSETVAALKKKIVDDHPKVYPDVGAIKVHALRAELNNFSFLATDEMTVASLCLSDDKELHISADVASVRRHRRRNQIQREKRKHKDLSDRVSIAPEEAIAGLVPVKCHTAVKQLSVDAVVGTSSANEVADCDKDVRKLVMDVLVETSSANDAAVLKDGIETMSSDPLDPNKAKQFLGVSRRSMKRKKGKKQSYDSNQVVPLNLESVKDVSEKAVIRERRKGSDDNVDVSVASVRGQVFSTMASKENTFFPGERAVGKDNEVDSADDRSTERKKESQKPTSVSASAIHEPINVATNPTNPGVALQDLDVSELIKDTLNDNKCVQTDRLARVEEEHDLSKNSQTEHIMTRVEEPLKASKKRKKSEKTRGLVNKIPKVPSFEHLKGISLTEQFSAVRKDDIAEEMEHDKLIDTVMEPFECINEDSEITQKKCKKPKKNTAADIPPTDHVGDLNLHAKAVREREMTNINDKSLPITGETETIINYVAEAGLKNVSNCKKMKKKVGTSKLNESQAGRKAQSSNSGTTQKEMILPKTETKNNVSPSPKKLLDSSEKDLESNKIGTPVSAPQESSGHTFAGELEKLGNNNAANSTSVISEEKRNQDKNRSDIEEVVKCSLKKVSGNSMLEVAEKSEQKDKKMDSKNEDDAESLGSSTKIPSNALSHTSVGDSNATYNIWPHRDNKMGNAADRSAPKRKDRRKTVSTSNKYENQAEGKSQSTDSGSITQKEKTFSKIEAKTVVPLSHKKLPDSSDSGLEKSVLSCKEVKKIVDTSIMNENQAEGEAQFTDSRSTFQKKNTLAKDVGNNIIPSSSKKLMDSSEKGLDQEPEGQTNADALFETYNAAHSSSVISKVKGIQDKKENNNGEVVKNSPKKASGSSMLEVASKSEHKSLLGVFEDNNMTSKNEDEAEPLGSSTKAPSNALSVSSSKASDATYNITPRDSNENGERNNDNSTFSGPKNLPFETILKRSGLYKRALEVAQFNDDVEEDDEVLPDRR